MGNNKRANSHKKMKIYRLRFKNKNLNKKEIVRIK